MAKAKFLDRMCLAHRATGLWLRYAPLQNLIPSIPWIAHPALQTRKGRDEIFAIWQQCIRCARIGEIAIFANDNAKSVPSFRRCDPPSLPPSRRRSCSSVTCACVRSGDGSAIDGCLKSRLWTPARRSRQGTTASTRRIFLFSSNVLRPRNEKIEISDTRLVV